MSAIAWRDGRVRFLDQTLLPGEERWVETDDYRVVAEAIRSLRIRGAPLIGIAAAYAAALAAARPVPGDPPDPGLERALSLLAATRPTAVNLFHALARVRSAIPPGSDPAAAAPGVLETALALHREDGELCRAIAAHGAALLPDPSVIVTHCNTGMLATGGIGTALGIVVTAAASGTRVSVYAGETRPLLQGARLTAWELRRAGIPVTVLADGAVPWLLARGGVDAVLIGADRIAANGDTANKIGSYALAVAASAHGVPFYVAAPSTSIDPAAADGSAIPIERRPAAEFAFRAGADVVPDGVPVWTPAFDVTPARCISGIVTERGIHRPPYDFRTSPGRAAAP